MANHPELVRIAISKLIRFADQFAGIELHVLVGGKYVKLNYSEDSFIEILRKLQQKEVEDVYIKDADCQKVIVQIQQALSPKTFYDPKTTNEQRVEAVNAAIEVVKTVINQIGVDQETVVLLKAINTKAMAVLAEAPSVYAFVKQYKKNCSEQFLLCILTNYVMSLVIDTFDWRSEQVKEKGAMASLLCDVLLSKEDFALLSAYERDGTELPDKIKQHPVRLAEMLKKSRNLIPPETITIVEQHHERPDGSGFPHGIRSTRFNQLSTIFIVCQQFTQLLHEADYDYEKRFDIIVRLKDKYGLCKSFERSLDALMSVVD